MPDRAQVRVKEKVYYDGREREPGEQFEMHSTDLRILETLGKIEILPDKGPALRTTALKAEPIAVEQPQPETTTAPEPERKRTYRRRNLEAEK